MRGQPLQRISSKFYFGLFFLQYRQNSLDRWYTWNKTEKWTTHDCVELSTYRINSAKRLTHTLIVLVSIYFGWDKSLFIHTPNSMHNNIEYETILMLRSLSLSFALRFYFVFNWFVFPLVCAFLCVISSYKFPLNVIIQWPSSLSHVHACIQIMTKKYENIVRS